MTERWDEPPGPAINLWLAMENALVGGDLIVVSGAARLQYRPIQRYRRVGEVSYIDCGPVPIDDLKDGDAFMVALPVPGVGLAPAVKSTIGPKWRVLCSEEYERLAS